MSRRLALIVNPAASGGRAVSLLAPAERALEQIGARFRVMVTESAEDARARAREAVSAGEVVVAAGGDGLVGTLAGVTRDGAGTLAVLPAGRGNDFARVLGIPHDPAAAARVAATGAIRELDLAEVNGMPFVGIASAGFDSDANRIANDARLVRGNLVYVYAALRALAAWRPARFEVVIDGDPHAFSGYSVIVANSKAYGGGMYVVPHAELDDGRLDVMLAQDASKLHMLRCLPTLFNGGHVDDPAFRFLRGSVVELRADRPFVVYADGDPIAELPARVTVDRKALRVVAP